MSLLLLELLLAHLLGDFLLQPTKWVKDKQKKKIKSKYLYYHIGIHFLLSLLLTRFDPTYYTALFFMAIFHGLIDVAKLYFEKPKTAKSWFFIDQALHFMTILCVVNLFYPFSLITAIDTFYQPKNMALAVALLLVTYVTAIMQRVLLSRWTKEITTDKKMNTNYAGMYIGILERLFVFLFVVMNFWSGIGFLLAAKSIFRFGDLRRSKDIALTEYILIGTLLSFGFAILFGMLYHFFIHNFTYETPIA